jgi:hypothetical protein
MLRNIRPRQPSKTEDSQLFRNNGLRNGPERDIFRKMGAWYTEDPVGTTLRDPCEKDASGQVRIPEDIGRASECGGAGW